MSRNSIDAISNEKQLVAALSRLPVEPGPSARVRELISRGVEWSAAIVQARLWQVEPVVFGNLRAHFADAVPSEVLAEIAVIEREQRAFALSRTLQAVDLAKILTAAGIPTIVLKGPAIAIAAYGDCSRRSFADVDLLVPKADLKATCDVLVTRGYVPKFGSRMVDGLVSGQHALEFAGSGPPVEVHWSLLSRYLSFDLGADELWREAQVLQCVGAEITVLAPHHLFVYLCAHGAKHQWLNFRWVCDVAQLARRLTPSDAESVMELSVRTHTRRIVALALRLAQETFGEEPSPFPVEAFGTDRDTETLRAFAKERFGGGSLATTPLLAPRLAALHPYAEPLVFWIRSRERRRDRLACAARFVFEPAPDDAGRSAFSAFFRPARLAANALLRAVHSS